MAYYEDDFFHPTNTADDIISVGSNGRKKVNTLLAKMNGGDGYFQITKMVDVLVNGTYIKKPKKIAFYPSGPHGTTIRHAITGEYYPGHTIGSKAEYLYFKVGLSTGVTGLPNCNSPFNLFYDSYNEWSKHMQETLSDKDIAKWEQQHTRAKNSV